MENDNNIALKIPYFPGCTLKTTAANFELSAMKSVEKLGIEMVELPKWNCCGTVSSLSSDDLMKHLAPVRDFIRVEEMNENGIVDNEYRMLTLCSMCFNTLKRTNERVKTSPEDLKSINDFMYLEKDYKGKVDVIHLFELLDEIGFTTVKENVVLPLKGLKIAPYYGCLLLRPKSVGIDTAENPSIIERFISSIGGDPVLDWEARSRCCGSYHTVDNKPIVIKSVKGIIENAQKFGAEAIITSCPLCAFNLDNRQEDIKKEYPDFVTMPVFYFTQLLGLALGLEKEFLGFEGNYIDPEPLLKSKGLLPVKRSTV